MEFMRYTTPEIAQHMLNTGHSYTAATLAKELKIPVSYATGKLYNVRTCKRYRTEEKGKPVQVKVTDIDGQTHKKTLWEKVLNSSW